MKPQSQPIDNQNELEIQKKIAFTAGLLQGDVTIKTLIESLAEGIVIVNEDGRIVLINSRMSQLTGYERHEVMGLPLSVLIPESVRPHHKEMVKGFFKSPNIRPMGVGMDLLACKKSGESFPVEISLSYLQTDSGLIGIAFVTDITSRKMAEEYLRQRNKELDEYAHTVAHNLNTSLVGMVGYSELLLEGGDKVDRQTQIKYLTEIARSGHKMNTIINELLVFASVSKDQVNKVHIDMRPVLEEAIRRLRILIDGKEAELIIAEKLLPALGHANWIEEVWYNFISNAVKYGGNPPIIEIGSELVDNNHVRYFIKDNGPGLMDSQLKTIYQGHRLSGTEKVPGFGFGLDIVKKIVEKLDGYVDVKSKIGQGSEFSFYLKSL